LLCDLQAQVKGKVGLQPWFLGSRPKVFQGYWRLCGEGLSTNSGLALSWSREGETLEGEQRKL
jgi:hypothetical protein